MMAGCLQSATIFLDRVQGWDTERNRQRSVQGLVRSR